MDRWFLLLLNAAIIAADLPTLDYDAQWGPGNEACEEIQPFEIEFSDDMIADLRMRLRNNRRPIPTHDNVNFTFGFNSNELDDWINYWAEEYDFKERAAALNKYPQYKLQTNGLCIHFIKVGPVNKTKPTFPLLILHGWPGSTREFLEAIPLLIADSEDREFGLELIIPSLPGFGFSDAPTVPGMGGVEIAVVLRNLMRKLGYDTYGVQGGDWGSYIGSIIATMFSKEVKGFHTNLPVASTTEAYLMMGVGAYLPDLVVEPSLASKIYPLKNHTLWLMEELAYFYYLATKPDTIGVAMSDSPAGLLAFILQAFASGTRKTNTKRYDGGLLDHYTRDQLIDNLMMYWAENKITSSFRIYRNTAHSEYGTEIAAYPTEVPVCALQAPDDILYMSFKMLRTKYKNLQKATPLDEGGHFIALEKPDVYAANVLDSVKIFIDYNNAQGS